MLMASSIHFFSSPVHAAIAIQEIKAEKKGSKTNAARPSSVDVENDDRNSTY
jgi:hypothetical protein